MATYQIESHSHDVIPGTLMSDARTHNFLVLRNVDTGEILAELHAVAVDRKTNEPA